MLSAQDHPTAALLLAEGLGLVVELAAVMQWQAELALQQVKVLLFPVLALP